MLWSYLSPPSPRPDVPGLDLVDNFIFSLLTCAAAVAAGAELANAGPADKSPRY